MNIIDLKNDFSMLSKYEGKIVQVDGFIVASSSEQYLTNNLEKCCFRLPIKKPLIVDCIINYIHAIIGGKNLYYSECSINGRLMAEADGSFYLDELIDIRIKLSEEYEGEANFEEIRLNAEKVFAGKNECDEFRMFALREIVSFAYKTNDLMTIKRLIDIIKDESEDVVIRCTAYQSIGLVSSLYGYEWQRFDLYSKDVIGQIDWKIIEEVVKNAS